MKEPVEQPTNAKLVKRFPIGGSEVGVCWGCLQDFYEGKDIGPGISLSLRFCPHYFHEKECYIMPKPENWFSWDDLKIRFIVEELQND